MTIRDMFQFLKRCMETYLDPLVKILLKRGSDTSGFISEGGRGCPSHDDCRMLRLESALLPLDPADSFQVQLIAASNLPMPLPARCNHGQQYTLLQRLRQANIPTGKLFEGRLPRGSRLLKESFLNDVACCNGVERP